MNKVEFKIDTIQNFNISINNSYNVLIDIIKEMKENSNVFKEYSKGKTLDLFNDFMEKELNKQELILTNDLNKYNILFNDKIIPSYEELYNMIKESVGNNNE